MTARNSFHVTLISSPTSSTWLLLEMSFLIAEKFLKRKLNSNTSHHRTQRVYYYSIDCKYSSVRGLEKRNAATHCCSAAAAYIAVAVVVVWSFTLAPKGFHYHTICIIYTPNPPHSIHTIRIPDCPDICMYLLYDNNIS